MRELEGKVALVTGGSRGIGAGIVRSLAAAGAEVSLTYVQNKQAADAVASEVTACHGGRAAAHFADLTVPESIVSAVDDTVADFGRLDVLVNNAGHMDLSGVAVEDLSLDVVDRTLDVNVRACVIAAQATIPHLSQGGRIINVGSCLGTRVPGPGATLYATSKAAIHGLTKGLAQDLGNRGITVNEIAPGPVDTDMNPANGPNAEMQRELTALGRFGSASEIGAVAVFLAGKGAEFLTGATVPVDGGNTT